MPEWQGFVDHGMDAGTMTHRESTYIQELCQEAALRRQQNIWVDGSLRDVVWFKQVFEDIRRRHPVYRIGIIHVHASEPVVRARIAERARRTNRNVPERLILESLAAPARSLFELTSLCDWVARIDNEVSPTLTSFNQVDRSGHWSAMSSRWARTEPAPYEFPHRLAPVALQPIEELSLAEGEAFPPNGGVIKLVHREIGRGSGKELISELKVTPRRLIHLSMSVTSDIARKSLRIDEDSTLVAYVVPAGDADKTFQHGGALYFDRSEKLYAAVRIAGQCSTCHFRYFMHFNTPVNKTAEEVSAILRDEWRWGPVSLPEMRNGGAIRTTFVGREELPDVAGLGAYLFELRDGSFKLFTLRVPTS